MTAAVTATLPESSTIEPDQVSTQRPFIHARPAVVEEKSSPLSRMLESMATPRALSRAARSRAT